MIRPATMEDARALARTMRRADRRESRQLSGQGPGWAAEHSLAASDAAFAGFAPDGSLLAVFGAARDNLVERTATLWALTSEAVWANRRYYVRSTRDGFDAICRAMPDVEIFHNLVSTEYRGAIRWLERLGASLSVVRRPVRGFAGGLFAEFYVFNPRFEGGI